MIETGAETNKDETEIRYDRGVGSLRCCPIRVRLGVVLRLGCGARVRVRLGSNTSRN
jgi:hypothetical protein